MFSFCKPVSDKKRFLPHRQLDSEYTFTLFQDASSLDQEAWNSVNVKEDIFLNPELLAIVERCVHTKLQCRYVIVYHKQKPCGIIYYQVVDFRAGMFGSLLSRQVRDIAERKPNLFERFIDSNSEETLLRLFTCGNNLVSGDHGFIFLDSVPEHVASGLLLSITELLSREEKLRGTISAVLLKDFETPLQPEKLFLTEGYSVFQVEPNLVVELPPGVENLDQYVALFSKKYRNRARTILKASSSLEIREMSAQEMVAREKEIYQLYENLFKKAKFRLMQLPQKYFSEVKKVFRDRFIVKGFFQGEQLLAFSSCFLMPGNVLEAHYIGFDQSGNSRFELYQNILYRLIEEGLRLGSHRVNLGRTAAEIKTTVGAKPRELLCYIKPQNTISKLIQRPFISFLQPGEWTPRNPFKTEQEAAKQAE